VDVIWYGYTMALTPASPPGVFFMLGDQIYPVVCGFSQRDSGLRPNDAALENESSNDYFLPACVIHTTNTTTQPVLNPSPSTVPDLLHYPNPR